ncbi:tRNA (uracil-5-)-methyltransferase [Kwoniella heveanensis BCC8398]|uniref:tRNA (Uracil-5-)-methyltransferase n=1 Tax=Kwoniella heveanensis BCC8398 TaxID=1296120 RepID=A0A1B9GRU7_9TREE|nr:tRNA (uracil-5-)-methyltransferase [Kwoniella heveanensis BCC8398]
MASPPSLPPSPPAKRLKSDVVRNNGFTHITEAPVNALFAPSASPSNVDASATASTSKATVSQQPKQQQQQKSKKSRKQRRPLPDPYSSGDVMFHDVRDYLGKDYVDELIGGKSGAEWEAPEELKLYEIVELKVDAFTVSGESLSLAPGEKKWAVITPFAHPGDRIRAKIYKHDRLCSYADMVEIVEYSEEYRGGEGDRRKYPENGCKYFGECGGCQLQPVPYPLQLLHKRRTVELAYQRFSNLSSSAVPIIQPTIGSPKQWAYRTKITPHFDAPPKAARNRMNAIKQAAKDAAAGAGEEEMMNAEAEAELEGRKGWDCRIGFERKGRPGVMDIEECPIATPILNEKMAGERKRVKDTIMSFTKGATLLLRDSLPEPSPLPSATQPFSPSTTLILPDFEHVAITNHRAPVYERVGDYIFSFAAGSFFQNNNSILIPLTEYVKEAIFPPTATATPVSASLPKPTHLVDTYCGSGLFGITLSACFERVAGVEISQDSITAAKKNAEMNGLQDKSTWLCGKAEDIFGGLAEKGFAGEHSCVVVDPPRKGCDTPFLDQLLTFKPLTVVYVSCNVHTQARDIGYLVSESEKRGASEGWKYVVESLRGFDLFPQTAHVESVGVLRLVQA